MSEPVDIIVREGDCPCPGAPHTEEHVYLEPTLSLRLGSAATAAWASAESTIAAQQAALTEAYLPLAIVRWSFVERDTDKLELDPKATRPVAINRENMERLIPWHKGGFAVANEADRLYSKDWIAPLELAISRLSAPTPTDASTSQSQRPGSTPPTPLMPSSQNGSAGKRSAAPAR